MGIKEKAFRSLKWNSTATLVCTMLQILRLSILTFLLSKSDFGLIAIATMVISFTDVFSELGLTVALIHKQDITIKQYSSVFWLNVIMSVCMTLIVCSAAPFISSFYKEPLLQNVVSLLSLQILFNGFGKMFQTIKVKELKFDFISKIRILASLLGFFVTIILAYLNFGIYSLILGQLIQIGFMQFVYAISGMQKKRILFYFSLKEIKDIVRIGSFQLGSQILDFLSSKIDVMLIGRFFSMDDLGLYNIAKDLILKPFLLINGVSSTVFSSAFANFQDSLNMLKVYFLKLETFISFINVPVYTCLFVFSDIIVSILYSPEFFNVALYIRILSFTGLVCSITSQGGILQVSLGRTDIGLRWTIVRIFSSTGILYVTCMYSIMAVAYGQLLLSFVFLFVYYYLVIHPILISCTLKEYVKTFFPFMMFSFLISFVPFLIIEYSHANILSQILLGVFYLVLYLAFVQKFKPDFLCYTLSLLRK